MESEKRKKIKEIYEQEIRKILPELPENFEDFEKDIIESFDNPDTFKIDLIKVLLNKVFLSLQFVINVIRPVTPDAQILSAYLTQTEKNRLFETYKELVIKVTEMAITSRKKSYEEFLKDVYSIYMELRKIKEEIIKIVSERFKEEKSNQGSYII